MFAFSVTFKLLSLYLAFKYGDAGGRARPWILGAVVAVVFAGFDVGTLYHGLRTCLLLAAAYLVAAVVVLNLYYRVQSIALSLLVVAAGTLVLFFGVRSEERRVGKE